MISETMAKAINDQINAEIYSSYLYLSMSAYTSYEGLPGTANWLRIQAQEEMTHAMRFYAYLNRVGARVKLAAIDEPPQAFESPVQIFEEVQAHERKVTGLINNLVNVAREENDHATEIELQWFVTEQVEEEENVGDILSQLKLAGTTGGGLFMIDRELGSRVFTPPAAAE